MKRKDNVKEMNFFKKKMKNNLKLLKWKKTKQHLLEVPSGQSKL